VILRELSDKLRNLFGRSRRSEEAETDRVAARLQEKVFALVANMPTLPDTATRAMALADDPDTNLPEFARLIEGDAAIATAVLRLANSALYAGGMPAAKLRQAVVRLGMRQCQRVVVAIGTRSLFRRIAAGSRAQCEILWHHAAVTASLCRQINRGFRLGFDGEEFSAGLLHDLGRILLVLADPECFARAGAMDFHEQGDVLARERDAIGIDHCALGAWFGEHSMLPGALVQAIRYHHEPWLAEGPRGLAALVATADHMANYLHRAEAIEAYDATGNFGMACLWEQWSEEKKNRLLDRTFEMMGEAVRETSGDQGV
jgi:HD-like signal output (HDOD) protein